MSQELTTLTGVAAIADFEGKPIIITAGSINSLKAYLNFHGIIDSEEISHVSITVGPRAEGPAIILDAIELPTK